VKLFDQIRTATTPSPLRRTQDLNGLAIEYDLDGDTGP